MPLQIFLQNPLTKFPLKEFLNKIFLKEFLNKRAALKEPCSVKGTPYEIYFQIHEFQTKDQNLLNSLLKLHPIT